MKKINIHKDIPARFTRENSSELKIGKNLYRWVYTPKKDFAYIRKVDHFGECFGKIIKKRVFANHFKFKGQIIGGII